MRSIAQLKENQTAVVKDIDISEGTRRRMMDIGLTKGVSVIHKGCAPLGDPILISVRGILLALRKNDAKRIFVE